MFPDIPQVATGATATNFSTAVRTGNRIKLKSCVFSGVLHFDDQLEWDPGRHANLFVRAMLISDKQNPTKAEAESAWTGQAAYLYRENLDGPSQVIQANTQYTNWMAPINHQRYTVHAEKRIKISTGCGAYDPTAGTAGRVLPDVPGLRKFNIALKCKSRFLHYERETSVQPSGVAPFLVFHIVTMHGATVYNGTIKFTGKCRTVWENI